MNQKLALPALLCTALFFFCKNPGDSSNAVPAIETEGIYDRYYANEMISFRVKATDPDGDNVSLSLDQGPSGATLNGGAFEWQTTSSDTGTFDLNFVADDGTARSNKSVAIDIVYADVDTCVRIRVLRPNGGEVYHVGDTMTITWAIDKERGVDKGVRLLLSLYSGSYDAPSFNATGFRDDSAGIYTGNVGTYKWVVTPTLPGENGEPFSMINEQCVAQVWGDYQPNTCNGRLYTMDASDGIFSIRE
ncbi:MAG: hypothetical protein GF350_02385 [Chitinivibrionales bacterium]|nr:hypothetical protein [Chitinivibrionales bacterium]